MFAVFVHVDANCMNSYRALKAKEVELALAALQERLEHCPRDNGQHVIVLDHGIVIARGAPKDIQRNPAVIAAYLGAEEEEVAG